MVQDQSIYQNYTCLATYVIVLDFWELSFIEAFNITHIFDAQNAPTFHSMCRFSDETFYQKSMAQNNGLTHFYLNRSVLEPNVTVNLLILDENLGNL